MNVKDKATELIHKFTIAAQFKSYSNDKEIIRQCAIVCVGEIQKVIDSYWMEAQNINREQPYWNKVLTHLTNK